MWVSGSVVRPISFESHRMHICRQQQYDKVQCQRAMSSLPAATESAKVKSNMTLMMVDKPQPSYNLMHWASLIPVLGTLITTVILEQCHINKVTLAWPHNYKGGPPPVECEAATVLSHQMYSYLAEKFMASISSKPTEIEPWLLLYRKVRTKVVISGGISFLCHACYRVLEQISVKRERSLCICFVLN